MLNISLSPASRRKMRVRGIFEKFTRAPQGGTEEYWQKVLTEFDSHLYLRWSHLTKHYLIYYEYRGLLDVIRTFEAGDSFFCAFKNIQHNSCLTSEYIRQMAAQQREQEQKVIDDAIDEGARETAKAYRSMLGGKVTTDNVMDNRY
jgi:hypothetical protein